MTAPAMIDTSGVPIGASAGEQSRMGLTWEPSRPLDELQRVLTYALDRIRAKRPAVDLWWRYYDGDHPQLWMTEKLRRIFGGQFEGSLQDNYCGLAVEARVMRLNVTGWQLPEHDDDDAGTPAPEGDDPTEPGEEAPTDPALVTDADRVQAQWDANHLDLEQEELYRAAGVAGEAYVVAWPRYDDAGNAVTDPATGAELYDIAVNDARNVHLEVGGRRSERLWAAKVWLDTTAPGGPSWRANLYYPNELVRLVTRPVAKNAGANPAMPAKGDRFTLDPDDPGGPNQAGSVLVFRFARDRRGRSHLHNLLPIQNKINKLAANKMVAAEFLAWRQRWIMTAQNISDEALRPSPGAVLVLDPGGETDDGESPPTRVGEFAATELKNYDDAEATEVVKFFTIGMLPRHLIVDPGSPPSGDAIKADEGPFVSTVEDAQQMYGGAWQDLWAALGYDVRPAWADPEVANDEASARGVYYLVQAGCPVDVAIGALLGWDQDRLEAVREGVAAAQKLAADQAAAQHQQMMAAMDAGMSPGMGAAAGLGQ